MGDGEAALDRGGARPRLGGPVGGGAPRGGACSATVIFAFGAAPRCGGAATRNSTLGGHPFFLILGLDEKAGPAGRPAR